MPTLIEKPAPAPALLPTQVLHSRHRWERWRGVLIALLAGLSGVLAALLMTHPSWHVPDHVRILAIIWLGGLALTGIAAAIAWHFAPESLSDTAQGIDRNLSAKNRLEAMASLHESSSLIAKAQREETADYLRQQPTVRPVRILPWLIGGVIALAAIHFLLLCVWVVPALLQPPAPVPPPPPKELPKASIVWKSPEAESKANPVEEVPTVAVATSSTGLKNITLEMSVNGIPKKSQPIPAQPYDKEGKNTIKVSLYMDELEVQPFDLVSYYLRGQRITDQKVPDTTSAIQFVQVRPFRDDLAITNMPVEPALLKNLALITELKLAQLKAMKENFILAHTDLAVNDPVRVKENDRVGKNQGDLAKKTEEIVQYFIQQGVDANVIDLLQQAEAPMTDASKKILATKNTEAVPPQGKALDLIIQIEKLFQKAVNLQSAAGPTPPAPNDPFKDKQQHELKQRTKTTAGQLEILAKKQTDLAKDVESSPSTGDSSSGSPAKSDSSKPDGQDKPGSEKPQPSGSQGKSGSQGSPSPGKDSPSGQANPQDGANPAPDNGDKAPAPVPQSVDPFTPGPDKGTLAERQARVLQGVETLLNTNDVLPETVNKALQDAQKHATESIHQLDQGNDAGAREPAAAAAQDLQRAVKELNSAGDKETKQTMEKAQQDLNAAAQKMKDMAKDGAPGSQQPGLSDVAAKVQDIQKQLDNAADKQQDAGSAKDAQHLADLANQIGNAHIGKDLAAMAQKGLDTKQAGLIAQKLQDLAGHAGVGMNEQPTAQDIAKLISTLEASRANLARLAEKAGGPGTEVASTQNPSSNQPGKDQGQAQGQQPGKDQGQSPGQGQGQQPDKSQGQDQGQGQQPDKGQVQGQGEGQGQGQQPGKDQGPGQQAGKDQGQGQGTGDGQGDQPGGSTPGGQAAGNGQNGTAPGGSGGDQTEGGSGGLTDTQNKAFKETLSDVQDAVQQAEMILPNADAHDIQQKLDGMPGGHYQKVQPVNVVRAYRAINPPLEKLIQNLTAMLAQTQRQDLLKQPDLDEAPAAYRPAVSDYFENMSKDYHPDNADKDAAKKP